MGKVKRDEYLRQNGISMIDFFGFLPERPYSFGGIRAVPRKGTQDFALLYLKREEELKAHLNMNENETFVDIGANVGAYSLRIAKNYKDKGVKVIAIEAHPENYKALCRNIEINNLKDVVRAINKAVSQDTGFTEMYEPFHMGKSVGSALFTMNKPSVHEQHLSQFDGKRIQVECDSIDSLLSAEKADVMKMDIEGAEVVALKAATNTLKQLRKVIVEVHGSNLENVRRILEKHEFQVQIVKGDMLYLIGSKYLRK